MFPNLLRTRCEHNNKTCKPPRDIIYQKCWRYVVMMMPFCDSMEEENIYYVSEFIGLFPWSASRNLKISTTFLPHFTHIVSCITRYGTVHNAHLWFTTTITAFSMNFKRWWLDIPDVIRLRWKQCHVKFFPLHLTHSTQTWYTKAPPTSRKPIYTTWACFCLAVCVQWKARSDVLQKINWNFMISTSDSQQSQYCGSLNGRKKACFLFTSIRLCFMFSSFSVQL